MTVQLSKRAEDNGDEAASGTVLVLEDEVIITDLHERDPHVLAAVREAGDPLLTIHQALAIGVRALELVQVSVDTQLVEKAFDGMSRDFQQQVANAIGDISSTTEDLLDPHQGQLHVALAAWKQELVALFDTTFDPDSRRSALGKLDAIMREAAEEQTSLLKQLLDPLREDSPLGQALGLVTQQVGQAINAVTELARQQGVRDGEDNVTELTAAKGFTFEDQVHTALTGITMPLGDVAEHVGNSEGLTGAKTGDEVVTLNPDDTGGRQTVYVLEVKDRKVGLRSILDELERAMENRGAAAGIAVFSRSELAPVHELFHCFNNKAIVVFDKEAGDVGALRLACLWARWVARRELHNETDEIDIGQVEGLIGRLRQALERVSSVRRGHSSARKKIDEAAAAVDAMCSDIQEGLDELATAIRCKSG